MRRYLFYIYVALLALLSACSTEDVDQEVAEGKMTTVTLDVSALSLGATTRATGTPEDPAYNVEKIHSWWVVFVDKNSTVRKIVSRSSGLTTYVEEEQTKCDIPTGTYTLYSFANISQADLKTKTGLEFTEGSACPDVDSKTIALSNDWDKSTDIPMSGKQSVTVTGRANETFSVEVVRMLAKLEFQYSNESSKDVTLNSLTLKQSQADDISLLPNYTYLDTGWPADVYPLTTGSNLLETVTPTYSESKFGYYITGDYSDWVIDIKNWSSPTWYSRVLWNIDGLINSTDTYQISFTISSEKTINSFEVGFNNDNNSQMDKYYINKTVVTGGVDTPFSFTVKGSDLGTYNKYLQMNIIDVGDHEKVHIKDIKLSKPIEAPTSSYVRDYSTIFTSSENPLAAYSGSGDPASATDWFYMQESHAPNNVSGRYLLNLNITRQDGHTEDLMFALTKNLYSIYRNDHVVIPIIISDFMVDLDVNFYSPIGGYPALITTNSKEEFYCQFATEGFFKISPSVINASNGYSVVYNDTSQDPYYTYTITGISNPDDIFSITPAIEGGTGIIVGEMNTNEGTAYIDVEVTVHRSSSADQIYDRRVYIVRKNA